MKCSCCAPCACGGGGKYFLLESTSAGKQKTFLFLFLVRHFGFLSNLFFALPLSWFSVPPPPPAAYVCKHKHKYLHERKKRRASSCLICGNLFPPSYPLFPQGVRREDGNEIPKKKFGPFFCPSFPPLFFYLNIFRKILRSVTQSIPI